MPRLFVAVELPERIRDDIADLYEAIPSARWAEDAKLHITLRFIGDVDGAAARAVESALRTVTFDPFTLALKSTGFFPPRGSPKVLWCGISPSEPLARLQKQVERCLVSGAGLPPEGRKFHPHVTMARINGAPDDKLAQFLAKNALFETEPFMVSQIALYSSDLRSDGAVYTKEAEYVMG